MTTLEALYQTYCKFCRSLDCEPATFEHWRAVMERGRWNGFEESERGVA